jgi:hypothetical protein
VRRGRIVNRAGPGGAAERHDASDIDRALGAATEAKA